MKKWFFLIIFFSLILANFVYGQEQTSTISLPKYKIYNCPEELNTIYQENGEKCVNSYEEFISSPSTNHLWVEDEEITTQGKANDRARQFIYWVTTHFSIDNHPVLLKIWSTARNISYFFLLIIAALLGLTIIVGQKVNFELGIKIQPSVVKILTSAIFIFFSATIVITIIQLSDLIMRFFTENLGGKDLFNIYFSGVSTEKGYIDFIGIRDLNYKVQESIKTQLFLFKLTNISYYLLGIALILRKIILWFLLFVSPFLPLLFSFSLTKNIGWVWIGIFFQWVFYGPLLSLFLGAIATIWKGGIPYIFDFSRSESLAGYIYPTGTNILWGGPAQKLSILNNINYIDPYVEYIITLLMIVATIIFPWWLLRSFRDYCCDGINAIKNILLSNFGPGKNLPPNLTSPINLDKLVKTSQQAENVLKTRIETIEEIKKAKTEEIVNSLNIKANNLADIAKLETNQSKIQQINYLKNPTSATTTSDRQRYMNIRVELTNRAVKADPVAQKIVSSIFASPVEQIKHRHSIITSLPKMAASNQIVSYKVKLPTNKVQQITNTVISSSTIDNVLIETIAVKVGLDKETVKKIIVLFNQSNTNSPTEILKNIHSQLNINEEKIKETIKEYLIQIKTKTDLFEEVAKKENIEKEKVKEIIENQEKLVVESEKNIEEAIIIPQTVSLDEYEQVKQMWVSQYEKGEIPKTENIINRYQWVDNDIVLITNVLNKLYSDNEEIKNQGLDEVSYILPIFMINNFNGEQLVTYLKAKLEAAKIVKMLLDKEKEITEKLKKETDKIEINLSKKQEKAKEMEMKIKLEN